jgi:membrane-bound lytic murein transglycosylase D
MRTALFRVGSAWVALALVAISAPAQARAGKHEPAGAADSRSAKTDARPVKSVAAKPTKAKKPPKKPAKSTVLNKAPRKAGTAPGAPDPDKRASIAGETPKEASTEPSDLLAMKEVDDALFPELFGEPAPPPSAARSARVVADGLPPATDRQAPPAAVPGDFAWLASLEKPDIPFRWDARLVRYLDYFKNDPKGRAFARALVKRAGRYEVKIRAAAKARGVPEDIVWLALVESGMNPKIGSSAGAAGLWQFMPKAAQAYGLRVDKWVDERLDPERSTQAALRYLDDLHTRFGRWELAFAAYNMGHGGLLTAIRKYNTNDFWELSQLEAGVPYETALYVPKIVALAFVSRNKAVFGCDDVVPDPAEAYDVAVVGPSVSIEAVAGAAGASKSAIADLNPALVGNVTPPAASQAKTAFSVRVPEGKKAEVEAKLSSLPAASLETYTLRWGESLDRVAAQHGTTESKLRAMNGLEDPTPPRPGTTLMVPKGKVSLPVDAPVAVVPARAEPPAGRERVFYEVVWGDKIGDVARVLGITEDELSLWNNVDRGARLHGKMVLQAFVPIGKAFDGVRVTRGNDTKVLVVGSDEFFDYFESKNGRNRLVVTVAQGDTMKSLAARHGLTLGMMERINHRARTSPLVPGEKLVVYTKAESVRGAAAPKPAARPDELAEAPKPDDEVAQALGVAEP